MTRGGLTDTINDMSLKIKQSEDPVGFISSVSHELRTDRHHRMGGDHQGGELKDPRMCGREWTSSSLRPGG